MSLAAASNSGLRPFRDSSLTEAERAVLLTVLYADLFDYALTRDELHQRLVLRRTEPVAVRRCLNSLSGRHLVESGDYVTWKGREHLVDVRRRRRRICENLWTAADRYAAWLSRVPFVRMVAVSGSLAAENAENESDVDFFCITEPKRLWVTRLFIVPLSKMTRLFSGVFPQYLCPNYLLTLDTLEIQNRSLFTAHEVVQAIPMWGWDTHRRFLDANAWVEGFLPHWPSRSPTGDDPPRPLLTRMFERACRGRIGDAVDALVYHGFRFFYRKRASRLGWSWRRLEQAYRRDSYTVPEGGYIPVVSRLFARRMNDRMGMAIDNPDVCRLFPDAALPEGDGCYNWGELFRKDYGADVVSGSPPHIRDA